MKQILLIITIFFFRYSFAQNKLKMELKDVFKNDSSVSDFITTSMINYELSEREMKIENPFYLYSVNKKLPDPKQYSIFSIPIEECYALETGNKKYCIYIHFYGKRQHIVDALTSELGLPVNVLAEDVESGDFDFLHWDYNRENEIWLSYSDSLNHLQGYLLRITNIDIGDTILFKTTRATLLESKLEIILNDSLKINEFINAMTEVINDKDTLQAIKHPLQSYPFNRELLERGYQGQLFGIPAERIFSYTSDINQYSIYLLFTIELNTIHFLVEKLGSPLNCTIDEVWAGDFSYLHWHRFANDIFLRKDSSKKWSNGIILEITNLEKRRALGV